LAQPGQREEGAAAISEGLAAYQATGAELGRYAFLSLLAEACGKVGQVEEGLNVLDEALDVVDKTEERLVEAGIYQLKGELTLAQSRVQENQKPKGRSRKQLSVVSSRSSVPSTQGEREAKGYFLKAIEIAQKQQAKSLELRATMSLSRLWQQGKKKQARKMLAEIYGWFTEGFDTKDLQEAQALLGELG